MVFDAPVPAGQQFFAPYACSGTVDTVVCSRIVGAGGVLSRVVTLSSVSLWGQMLIERRTGWETKKRDPLIISDSVKYTKCNHGTAERYVCMYGDTYSKSKDQPGKVANLARGQLNRGY